MSRQHRNRISRISALAAVFLAGALGAAAAQEYPTGGGRSPGSERDSVTGYLCVGGGCVTLRLPDANCLCQKQNPGETRLSRLRLKCSTKEGGVWVACPVKPRYGISVN